MGVVGFNVEPEIEIWMRGFEKGKRSQVINHLLKQHIRGKLGDKSGKTVEECSATELIQIVKGKVSSSNKWKQHDYEFEYLNKCCNRLIDFINKYGVDEDE